jgi:hypothetical protein
MFVDDQILGLRLEFVNDIRIPRVADQDPTSRTVRGVSAVPDERCMFQAVRRIGSTEVRED